MGDGVTPLVTLDMGHWREVARAELEPEGTVAVFQTNPDGAVRYLIFRYTSYWACQHQSGHSPSLEEAVADSVRWQG